MSGPVETEIKLKVASAAEAREKLLEALLRKERQAALRFAFRMADLGGVDTFEPDSLLVQAQGIAIGDGQGGADGGKGGNERRSTHSG